MSNRCFPNTHSLRRKAEDGNRGHEQNQIVELAAQLGTVLGGMQSKVLHRCAYSVSGVFTLFCLGPGVDK